MFKKIWNYIKSIFGKEPLKIFLIGFEKMIFSRTFLGFCLATFFLYHGKIQDYIWLSAYAIFATIVVVQNGDVIADGLGKLINKKFIGFAVACWLTFHTDKMSGNVWLGAFAVFAIAAFAEGLVAKALGNFTEPEDPRIHEQPNPETIEDNN